MNCLLSQSPQHLEHEIWRQVVSYCIVHILLGQYELVLHTSLDTEKLKKNSQQDTCTLVYNCICKQTAYLLCHLQSITKVGTYRSSNPELRNFLLYTTENVLPNHNFSMSLRHLDHVLIVYNLMEHVTWKSPGPMCGWVGRILHPDSCTSVSSWSKVSLLSIWSVAVPLCRQLLPCPSRWHGSLPRHGLLWLTCELHCSPLP